MAVLDLACLSEDQYESLFEQLAALPPGVLVLKSAHHWFGRSPILETGIIQQWLAQRRTQPGLTLITTRHRQAIKPSWQRSFDGVIEFSLPAAAARQTLWRQAIPADLALSDDLTWGHLAQFRLSGGDIGTLAQTAIALAQQSTPPDHRRSPAASPRPPPAHPAMGGPQGQSIGETP